jgi:hypothetical protein
LFDKRTILRPNPALQRHNKSHVILSEVAALRSSAATQSKDLL